MMTPVRDAHGTMLHAANSSIQTQKSSCAQATSASKTTTSNCLWATARAYVAVQPIR